MDKPFSFSSILNDVDVSNIRKYIDDKYIEKSMGPAMRVIQHIGKEQVALYQQAIQDSNMQDVLSIQSAESCKGYIWRKREYSYSRTKEYSNTVEVPYGTVFNDPSLICLVTNEKQQELGKFWKVFGALKENTLLGTTPTVLELKEDEAIIYTGDFEKFNPEKIKNEKNKS